MLNKWGLNILKLMVTQNWLLVKGEYEVCHEDFIPYYKATFKLAKTFECSTHNYVACLANIHPDSLALLTATLALLPKSVSASQLLVMNFLRELYA